MAGITNIGIVDDHALLRKGVVELMNGYDKLHVSYEASNGQELIDMLDSNSGIKMDVVLLDIKMPVLNGIDTLKVLSKSYPHIKVIMLSMFDDTPYIIEAIKFGAKGFLLKNTDPEEIIDAIESVQRKDIFVNEHLTNSLLSNIRKKNIKKSSSLNYNLTFTKVEDLVLEYICQGYTNMEIANEIFKSVRTVEGYRKKLLDKTNTKNTAALVAWAFRNGFVE